MKDSLPPDFLEIILKEINWLTGDQKDFHQQQSAVFKPLYPIFQRLLNKDKTQEIEYCYALEKLGPESIFPEKSTSDFHQKNKNQYGRLLKDFSKILPNLKHRSHETRELWFEHFESLIMLYFSAIPHISSKPDFDVSLYDHAKTSAAFAVADYLYDRAPDKGKDDKTYLMVSGGISGIQGFIFRGYGESRKHRSKLLRGRSFAVSLLSELAADMLCREMGLPSLSVILNAAGRFSILCPNTRPSRNAVKSVEARLNKWLVRHTYGETGINISLVSADRQSFEPGNFQDLWKRIEKQKEAGKFSPINLDEHGGVSPEIKDYLESFKTQEPPLSQKLCPLCGKRPSHKDTEIRRDNGENESSCRLCSDYRFMGTMLVRAGIVRAGLNSKHLAVLRPDAPLNKREMLAEPFFDNYQIAFISQDKADELAKQGFLLKYWDIGNEPSGHIASRFINGYVPVYKDDIQEQQLISSLQDKRQKEILDENTADSPKTFELIALKAKNVSKDGFQGTPALGILKADVDDLGMLMACGIGRERFTLARISTLSRQMNNFFAVYLPWLLENQETEFPKGHFQDVYTVFAGGDDLFLIGPWNRVIDLSGKIRERFEHYVCHNPNIHFSAGISFHKPHTPVDLMARTAEAELEKSKSAGEKKNRLTLFSETVEWSEMDRFNKIKQKLESWTDPEQGILSQAMLFSLNELMEMARQEKLILDTDSEKFEDMTCAKWRSLVAYFSARNVGRKLPYKEKQNEAEKVAKQLHDWIDNYQGRLKIPVWQILYNRR